MLFICAVFCVFAAHLALQCKRLYAFYDAVGLVLFLLFVLLLLLLLVFLLAPLFVLLLGVSVVLLRFELLLG